MRIYNYDRARTILLLIAVRNHADEPLVLVRKLSPRYLTPFRPGTRVVASNGVFLRDS